MMILVPQNTVPKHQVLDLQNCQLRATDLSLILEKLASLQQDHPTHNQDQDAPSSTKKRKRTTTTTTAAARKNPKAPPPIRELLLRKAYGVSAIVAELERRPMPVKCIILTRNRLLGNASMDHWIRWWPRHIHTLDLSSCGLTAAGVEQLCQFLMRNNSPSQSLQWLSLSKNTLGVEGARAVARLLQHQQSSAITSRTNHHLHTLLLHDCQLGAEGYALVAKAMAVNRTLRHFMVGDRRGDGETPLQQLTLDNGGSLLQNTTLRSLGFCNLPLTSSSMIIQQLLSLVRANPSLTCLQSLQQDICHVIAQRGFPMGQQHWHIHFHALQWWLGWNQCGRGLLRNNKDDDQRDDTGEHPMDSNLRTRRANDTRSTDQNPQGKWFRALIQAAAHTHGVDYAFLLLQGNPSLFTNAD